MKNEVRQNSMNIFITKFELGHYLHLFAPVFITNTDNLYSLSNLMGSSNKFVIEYDTSAMLNRTLQILNKIPGYTKSYYILIIHDQKKLKMKNILMMAWNSKITRFIILWKKSNVVQLYGFDFGKWNCGNRIRQRVLGYCNPDLNNLTDVFTKKIYKYWVDCPFKVIWSTSPPWICGINQMYPGLHLEIVNLFKIASKFDLKYMPENDVYAIELQRDYKFDSILRDFKTGYADLYVGLASYFGNIPVEKTFITDNKLYFAMPKPRQISYWKTFLKVFNWIYCVIIAAITIFMSFLVTFFNNNASNGNRFYSFFTNMLDSFPINFGMSIHIVASNRRVRILICK